MKKWLPVGVTIIAMSGLVYGAVQQDLRTTANDPQIQMAKDAVAQITAGKKIDTVISASEVDMAKSLAPFLIVYSQDGLVLGGSGQLEGKSPVLPAGVLDYVKTHGEDRVTWQPRSDVRIAAVIERADLKGSTNYVLAGRNLAEVEKRESKLTQQVGIGMIVALIVSWIATML